MSARAWWRRSAGLAVAAGLLLGTLRAEPEGEAEGAAEAAIAGARVVWVDRGAVRVVGEDRVSVQAVAALAEDLAVAASEWTPWRDAALAARPEVHLVPAAAWVEATAVVRDESVRWPVVIRLRWGEATLRREAREAVVSAWLGQVYAERSAREPVPSWLVLGVVHALEVRQNPAWRDAAVRWAEDQPVWPELDAVLAGSEKAPEAAYWLWQYLRGLLNSPVQWRARLDLVPDLAGPWPVFAVLYSGDPERGSRPEFREQARHAWQAFAAAVRAERDGAYATLTASAQWADGAAWLEVGEPGARRLGPAEWFVAAAEAPVREALAHHVDNIRQGLGRVHPVWHNVLLSLGRLAEAAREGDAVAAVAAYRAWQADLAEAREVAELLRELTGR